MPRKKPYSGKQKKLQLQEKKRRKQNTGDNESDESGEDEHLAKGDKSEKVDESKDVASANVQTDVPSKSFNPDRYRLQFLHESNAELNRRKEIGRQALHHVPEIELEINDEVDLLDLGIAKRPPWDYRVTTKELEKRESKYFQEFLEKIFSTYSPDVLSYFEMNLETWRQLWRVLEMSDIMLMIVDIRYPMLHFSPALYNHIVHELGKHAVLVLNKVDMVPPELVVAWKSYFLSQFPKLYITCFTSYPKEAVTNRTPGKGTRKRGRGGRFTTNMGAKELLEICENIVHNNVDLSSWRHKIESKSEAAELHDGSSQEEEVESDVSPPSPVKFKNGVLTIGCIGYPNVGKSSLLNGLKGMKVVSVSKTPGHTKHFQTIFITPTVKLCDCPGLVFPSRVDKALQVLAGIYPISQVREYFSAIRYLSERINVVNILHLQHPDPEAKEWSPYDICEAWALKRGLLTAKAGRPDINRAANMIMRMGLDGRLCLALRPPGFTKNREIWKQHQDTQILIDNLSKYQHQTVEDNEFGDDIDENEDETSDEDEDGEMTTKNPFALLADD